MSGVADSWNLWPDRLGAEDALDSPYVATVAVGWQGNVDCHSPSRYAYRALEGHPVGIQTAVACRLLHGLVRCEVSQQQAVEPPLHEF